MPAWGQVRIYGGRANISLSTETLLTKFHTKPNSTDFNKKFYYYKHPL